MDSAQRVVVVGAGIVGLSTAYWLVKRGVRVQVVEQGPVPCPLAASADHHRLIRYPYGSSEAYCARMPDAFGAWRAMWDDLPGPVADYYAETGILAVCQETGDFTDRSRVVMEKLGVPFERVDGMAAMAERFPFLEAANLSYAMLSEGGALMANRILTGLATWLRAQGAEILENSPVTSVDTARGETHLADGRVLTADRVIVAAGIGTKALIPELDLPLTPHRCLIVYGAPPDDLAEAYAAAPCWTDLGGDMDLWGMPAMDGLPMKFGNGRMGRKEPEAADRHPTAEEAAASLAAYASRFRGADRFRISWAQANYWTHAPDHDFLLQAEGRVLAVSACSGHGFKFGALTGRDVADAVTEAGTVPDIAARMRGMAAA